MAFSSGAALLTFPALAHGGFTEASPVAAFLFSAIGLYEATVIGITFRMIAGVAAMAFIRKDKTYMVGDKTAIYGLISMLLCAADFTNNVTVIALKLGGL